MKWRELSRKIYHHNEYRKLADVKFELPDGSVSTYSLIPRVDVVCVLALTEDNEVLLARQFRPGPGEVLDELPGGIVDPNEDFDAALRRELIEETGYECGELRSIGTHYDSAYSELRRHQFVATGCKKTSEQKLDPHEFIEVVTKPINDFITQIKKGQCTDIELAWAGLVELGIFKRV